MNTNTEEAAEKQVAAAAPPKPETKYAVRRARGGTEHRHTFDNRAYAQLLHLQATLAAHLGQEESLSTLLRRAIGAHSRTIGKIVTGLRDGRTRAKAQDALASEKFHLNSAALGGPAPFPAFSGKVPPGAEHLSFTELVEAHSEHHRNAKRSIARLRKEGKLPS